MTGIASQVQTEDVCVPPSDWTGEWDYTVEVYGGDDLGRYVYFKCLSCKSCTSPMDVSLEDHDIALVRLTKRVLASHLGTRKMECLKCNKVTEWIPWD